VPHYFVAKSTKENLPSMTAADALAETMNDAAANLGVRIVAVKPRRPGAFVYAISGRHKHSTNAIVDRLRRDGRLAGYELSAEKETSDGPFA
jgi:hypothetical protein